VGGVVWWRRQAGVVHTHTNREREREREREIQTQGEREEGEREEGGRERASERARDAHTWRISTVLRAMSNAS
jgi:hypothetical protein